MKATLKLTKLYLQLIYYTTTLSFYNLNNKIEKNSRKFLVISLILFLFIFAFYNNPSIIGFASISHETSSNWTGTYLQTNSSTLTTSIILDNDTATTHYSDGNYTSQVLDANSNTQWNTISWSNTTSTGEIKFQVKSCNDADCDTEIFIGPDNTTTTYLTSNSTLNTTLTPDNQYFQYKSFFSTTGTSKTPYLHNIEVNYNSFPINSTPIINSTTTDQQNYTNETLSCNFLCNDTNADDTLTYDIYFYNNGTFNLSFLSQSCSNPEYVNFNLTSENTTKNELWSCSVNITDNSELNSSTAFSNNITILNSPPFNYTLSPINDSYTSNTTVTFLINNGTDFDLDTITYYLEVWNNSDLTKINYVNNLITEADVTSDTINISEEGIYYWRILANDGTINGSWTENQTIIIDTTFPPSFNLTSPSNNSISNDSSPILTWTNSSDTNFDNYTIIISNVSDFSYITNTYRSTTNSFSEWTSPLEAGAWYWYVEVYDKASNYNASDQNFTSTIQTKAVPQKISRIQGTIMESTTEKLFNINIIGPEDITIYSNDTLTVPLIVTNPSDINFGTISLNVSTDTTDVTPLLDTTLIPALRSKEQRKINLKITTHTLPGTYGITITATVINPNFVDTFRIFANLIERDAASVNEVSQQLNFAKRLFSGNPACLELSEFIKQADLALKQRKYDKALNLAESAISGCNKLISLEKKEGKPFISLPFSIEKLKENKNLLIIASEILGLLILIIIIFKHLKKKSKESNKFYLFLIFLLILSSNKPRRKFTEIRKLLLKTIVKEKELTLNRLASKSGLSWKTVKLHIIYLKGKGFIQETLSTPYVRIFKITEKGIKESKNQNL